MPAHMKKEIREAKAKKKRIVWYKKMIIRKVRMINNENHLSEVFVICRELLKID